MPENSSEQPTGRMVVTLSVSTAVNVRKMAAEAGVKVPEIIRRGLTLYQLWASLKDGEYMMIKRSDQTLERVVLPVL